MEHFGLEHSELTGLTRFVLVPMLRMGTHLGEGCQGRPRDRKMGTFIFLLVYLPRLDSSAYYRPPMGSYTRIVCVEARCNQFWLAFLLIPKLRLGNRKEAEWGNEISG